MAKKKSNVTYLGTGRRKSSVARVYITQGSGQITVNGVELEKYLPHELLRSVVRTPLALTETSEQLDVLINVYGGGFTGQAGAMRLGIARALLEFNSDLRPTLKSAGLLTRDSRSVERKKYGLKGARRAPQFSKR